MRTNEYLVYAAGPISGLSYDGATGWRERLVTLLADSPIRVLSPMRGKDYLTDEDVIAGAYPAYALSSQRGIMTRDHNDCKRADAIVVNLLGAGKVSIGTVMEIAWAHAYRVPLVLVMEEGNPHNHPMVREAAGYVVSSLEEAVVVLRTVLLP